MDYFTKYLNLYALTDQGMTNMADYLFEDYIGHHGLPQSLHRNQGRQFDISLSRHVRWPRQNKQNR